MILGLPESLGLGDSAALLPAALRLPTSNGTEVGFMPHFESAQRGVWRQAEAIRAMREPPYGDPTQGAFAAPR